MFSNNKMPLPALLLPLAGVAKGFAARAAVKGVAGKALARGVAKNVARGIRNDGRMIAKGIAQDAVNEQLGLPGRESNTKFIFLIVFVLLILSSVIALVVVLTRKKEKFEDLKIDEKYNEYVFNKKDLKDLHKKCKKEGFCNTQEVDFKDKRKYPKNIMDSKYNSYVFGSKSIKLANSD